MSRQDQILTEVGSDPYDWGRADYIDGLIRSSCLPHTERDRLRNGLSLLTPEEMESTIQHLHQHQRDRIDSGDNYNMTDIKRKLSQVRHDNRINRKG